MRERVRKTLALATLAAVVATPGARVLIDAHEPAAEVEVEASHDPDRCRLAHHHRACVQLFASAAAPAPIPPDPVRPPTTPALPELDGGRAATEPIRGDAHPRGPPTPTL